MRTSENASSRSLVNKGKKKRRAEPGKWTPAAFTGAAL
jgi:hypothetical protein